MSSRSPSGRALRPDQVVSDLHELNELTADERGAQRLCWTPTWAAARSWFTEKLRDLPVETEQDEAGNLWVTLAGENQDEALLIGGHLDSVPNGGWLDGCLNVLGGLAVLRRLASEGVPPISIRLVDWADEEGARWGGRSMWGSSAAARTRDPMEMRGVTDVDGITFEQAVSDFGVSLETASQANAQLASARAYLELHIEQGPVLEDLDLPLGAVTGTVGIERHLVRFSGQSAHAGATPMDRRRDTIAAASRLVLANRQIAIDYGGFGTVGHVKPLPDIPTAVAGYCEISTDHRHEQADALESIVAAVKDASALIAEEEGVGVEWTSTWRIPPIAFEPKLVELCSDAVEEITGNAYRLPSGTLHDAAEVARAGIPTVMLFVQSLGGISHARQEDTLPEHIELAVQALDRLTTKVLAGW